VKNNYDAVPNKVIENYLEVELTVTDDDTTMPTMTADEQISLRIPRTSSKRTKKRQISRNLKQFE
jgi:hypothetical protein